MKALIIVDMQKDFLPNSMIRAGGYVDGALAVKGGESIIPSIVKEAYSGYDLIVATRDFHPQNHVSFKNVGGEWPMHCVAGSEGAQIVNEIDMVADVIFSKGTDADRETYSGFDGTGLGGFLQGFGIDEVVVVGVATDYCVRATALDAKSLGFDTTVLLDCIAAVSPDTGDDAILTMHDEGIKLRRRS